MDTSKLKTFASLARRTLMEQVKAKLSLVLAVDSAAQREAPKALKQLQEAITKDGQEQVIERVAYIWFNRFCALRFMDVNRYTRIGVVSPAEGQFQPEILAEAKMGHIDDSQVPEETRQRIFALLNNQLPSADPQTEAYRLLLVATCNHWHAAMPFLFQRIDDYTELLMPDNLLSANSILAQTREAMTSEACADVEVIGWLYQFYIAEKKDQVFDGLKKNKKVTPENIPAATQLFTPGWIVRYLVENSLGRLWLLNRPNSNLVELMDYYIKPEQAEEDFLRISKPEEIKICDPACGSGHMLTYAFDLLYAIYEEEGYETAEIPEKILTHNLYGIEIDERAGELAAFALTMKARAKQRRFFGKSVKPNICVLENVLFDEDELDEYMSFVGRDLFTSSLKTTLVQFEEADNFGSLIRPETTDVKAILETLEFKNVSGQLFLSQTHQKALQALEQADYLSPKYHVVIANPPYMGGKGMNTRLRSWLKKEYSGADQDLYSAFISRSGSLCLGNGFDALITMDAWAFAPGFEEFRKSMLVTNQLQIIAHFGTRAFDTISGEVVSTLAYIRKKAPVNDAFVPCFLDLRAGKSERHKQSLFADTSIRYARLAQLDFNKIDGAPLAYWLPKPFLALLSSAKTLKKIARPRSGLTTSDNDFYLRYWWEVDKFNRFITDINYPEGTYDKWVPINGGSNFRRWYGSNLQVLLWENNGKALRNNPSATMANPEYQFKKGVTWSKISGTNLSVRRSDTGFMFTAVGLKAFPVEDDINSVCGMLNSKLVQYMVPIFSSNLTILSGDIAKYPFILPPAEVASHVNRLCSISKADWDSYETSWGFTNILLLRPDYYQPTLTTTYLKLRTHWREMTLEMQRLEEENNHIFIDTYSLQNELMSAVPLNEITLNCNPHYRYRLGKQWEDASEEDREVELEKLLLADTMRELVSYAVGCMFGRYSLDQEGLVLANQGDTVHTYYAQIPEPSFKPDEDNVIPMLDGDWFTDDVVERFKEFLKVTFGIEHYDDNLAFIEKALNVKGSRNYSIRDYFLKEFYADHWQRYKKRPIYWLFSSPKGSFNALIYMHRYRPDTVSVVLNGYLREYRDKLIAQKAHLEAVSNSASSSQSDKTKALKEIERINKVLIELDEYERDTLYPLATEQVEIDLDDGVKVNYPKLGAALKTIPGLAAKDSD